MKNDKPVGTKKLVHHENATDRDFNRIIKYFSHVPRREDLIKHLNSIYNEVHTLKRKISTNQYYSIHIKSRYKYRYYFWNNMDGRD